MVCAIAKVTNSTPVVAKLKKKMSEKLGKNRPWRDERVKRVVTEVGVTIAHRRHRYCVVNKSCGFVRGAKKQILK